MKLTKYITIACIVTSLSGCDYLDFDESIGKTQEEMYTYFENISSLATYIYSQLPQDYGAIGGAVRDAATDNAVYTWNSNSVYDIYNGNWSPLNPIDDVWGNYYTAIRAANSFLENYSLEKLERFQWNPNYKENMEKAKMYVNEVRALRAFYYLELAKRYGDIPLLTRTYGIDEINTVSETLFDKVIEFIAQECSEVAPALPVSQKEFYNESGRVTRGMALSVKARALLYAASKLHNPSGEKSKWEKAAEAASEPDPEHDFLPIMAQRIPTVQLLYYCYLYGQATGKPVLDAAFVALGEDGGERPLFGKGMTIEERERALSLIPRLIGFILLHMELCPEFRPREGAHCRWCSWRNVCIISSQQ